MSLGVVPLAISAWNPEMAPQAMVMNTKGNTLPPKSGPVPSTKGVMAGILICGCVMTIAIASRITVPSLRNVDR